ncbi:MAG: addiction module protein [Acidobacteria bacterium]|nr:addiction module protein [Acidobacteriota bacterium]
MSYDKRHSGTLRASSQLSESERAELAGLLLETLHSPADPDVEAAWAREVERRLEDYRAGRAQTVSWQELRARLHRVDR